MAEQAAKRKSCKYAELPQSYIIKPVAVENLGFFDLSSLGFLTNFGNLFSHARNNIFAPAYLSRNPTM